MSADPTARRGGFHALTKEVYALHRHIDRTSGSDRLRDPCPGHRHASTVAIQACLWTGELGAAKRGGAYLLRLAELQPAGSDRWYWMLDSDGELVTDPADHSPFTNGDFDFATGEEENFFLQKGKTDQ